MKVIVPRREVETGPMAFPNIGFENICFCEKVDFSRRIRT